MTKFSENFTYKIDGKKVASMGDFYFLTQGNTYDIEIDGLEVNAKRIDNLNKPFFLDEIISDSFSPRNKDKTEEELVDILKRDMNIGAPDWQENNTGGSVFERVQDTSLNKPSNLKENKIMSDLFFQPIERGKIFTYNEIGKKQNNKNDLGSTNPLANTFPKQFNDKERLERTTKKVEKYLESLEIGKKETEGKLFYELSWEFIEEMAKRMANNKSDKYPLFNWKKNICVEDLKQAINRHHIEVMKGNYQDGEELLGHIVSYACNSMMLWEQLKNK